MNVPKIDPTKTYKPLMAFAQGTDTYNAASRCRGSDPVVTKNPELFIAADASDLEEAAALRDRFPGVIIGPTK